MPFPDPNQLGHYYSDEAGVARRWNQSSGLWVLDVTPRRTPHTFAIQGAVAASTTFPGFFVPVAAGETLNLIAIRYKVLTGTSVAFKLSRTNAAGTTADIAGFGTTASPLSCTTTAQTTDPTDVALAADDYINLVTGAIVATPADMSVTLYFESTA